MHKAYPYNPAFRLLLSAYFFLPGGAKKGLTRPPLMM